MARRTTHSPTGRLRGAHPRHRHPRRDAVVVPRVRLLRHLLPRAARRARRPQAGPAPDPLHDERHGHPARPRPRQVRARRRRGHGPAAPPRRRRDLRRPGPHRAALVDAAADGRRPRQLRLPRRRRPAGRHALHRVPDGTAGRGDDRVDRRGHRRLPAQLRQPRDRAVGPAVGDPQPRGQRHHRHRGRHGHQHGAAQPGRGRPGAAPPDQAPRHRRRRPDALHPGPRPADRRQDRRARRDPRRLRDRPRHVPHAGHRPGRDDRPPQGHRRHRAPLRRRHREGRRADQDPRPGQEAPGHRRPEGPHRPLPRPPAGDRGQERLRTPRRCSSSSTSRRRWRTPSASTTSPSSTASRARSASRRCSTVFLDHRYEVVRRRSAVPPQQEGRPAAPGRRPADRAARHRRGHPGDPHQRRLGGREGATDLGLRPLAGAGRLHPRDAAAPAHPVLPDRAGEGAGDAPPRDRGARGDPRRRGPPQAGRERRAGRGGQDVRHARAARSCSSRPAPVR